MTSHAPTMAELDSALLLPHRRKMEILFAILLVIFLSALDQTIVGVALPRIVGELQGTNELYTWVITSYLLTATITGVFYGKLSDIYGRRPMLLFGVSVFLIGSVLSGLSWSMESLIIFRGVQGIGAVRLAAVVEAGKEDVDLLFGLDKLRDRQIEVHKLEWETPAFGREGRHGDDGEVHETRRRLLYAEERYRAKLLHLDEHIVVGNGHEQIHRHCTPQGLDCDLLLGQDAAQHNDG